MKKDASTANTVSGQTERKVLSLQDAVSMLPDGKYIHTFVQGGFALIGADWRRSEVIKEIKQRGAELSGPSATAMNHGLVILGGIAGPLFVETRKASSDPERVSSPVTSVSSEKEQL